MRMYDIITDKKQGRELSKEQIEFFIKGYTDGHIPDYQASALLMAIYFKGMTERETVDLTECMTLSGQCLDLSDFGHLTCDKHSTGGVGDKTTLVVAPLVACLGGVVAKMSGRGLGHTGGTIDKLESIAGYNAFLSEERFKSQAKEIGVAVIGQTGELTPADKKLYALRDVTGTVDSIPLIASSVMCKKLAAGAKNIVLDVKVGSGAFMKTPEEGKKLAEICVKIGKAHGRNTAALITDMDKPLGKAVGNALEVMEAIEVLKGRRHGEFEDICVELSANMLSLCKDISVESAENLVRAALENGSAFEKFESWITAQGGDLSSLKKAEHSFEIKSEKNGFITAVNAESIGLCAAALGAGRRTKDDSIDFGAGIEMEKTVGDRIKKGDTLAVLYASDKGLLSPAAEHFKKALTFGESRPEKRPHIFFSVR